MSKKHIRVSLPGPIYYVELDEGLHSALVNCLIYNGDRLRYIPYTLSEGLENEEETVIV